MPAPLRRLGAQPGLAASLAPSVHISYGQSWRSNGYPSFGAFGWNPPRSLLACHTSNVGRQPAQPGPLPNSAGIWLPGTIDGVTPYAPPDAITIGRCAVLAQQRLRRTAGMPQSPILEFCAAYPASSWTLGQGGGLRPGGTSWTNMLKVIAVLEAMPATGLLRQVNFRSVGYTQGGSAVDTAERKEAELAAMCRDFDRLDLPGTRTRPLDFYFELPAPVSNARTYHRSAWGTYAFCRANANGRSWGVTPWYQWPFNGVSNIHLNAYGTARVGEMEGYAKFVREDENGGLGHYYPLWRSRSKPIEIRGQTILVPFDRPSGAGFARGALAWRSEPNDGIKIWPQYGWHVRRGDSELTVTPSINDLTVALSVAEPLRRGDRIEISYAFYGPGGPNPATCSGVGGNLMMGGPPSPLFASKSINAWAWPFAEMVNA